MDGNLRLLGGLGLGASLMYLFDPMVGRRRRAMIRDKMIRVGHKTVDAIDVTARDLKNRAAGYVAEARGRIFPKEVSDEFLAERVRAKLSFLVTHPSSIEVTASDGVVTLEGPILKHEVDRLLRGVSAVRGVKSVDNRLEAHETAEGIPGLQGEPPRPKGGEVPELLQKNWSPAARFAVGTAAGALLLYGARQTGIAGATAAIFGGGMLARALTNMELKRLLGIGASRRGIDVHKIINVSAPVEEVFSFWTNYENFPRFMANVREVQDIGNDRSRWIVAGPAGAPVEWTAEITNYVPNESIGWKTVPGSPIAHGGIVRFEPNPDGSTRVEVKLSYHPAAGAVGHAVAALFGADPESEIDADLMRMKSMIETGVPPHDAARAQ